MKQFIRVSKFLNVTVQKTSPKADIDAGCEVIAIAEANTKGVALHKGFKHYSETVLKVKEECSAKAGASCLVRFGALEGAKHLLIVGLGKDKAGINELGALERFRRLGATTYQALVKERLTSAAIHLESFFMREAGLAGLHPEMAAYAFAEGAALASYKFDKYFSKKEESKGFDLILTAKEAKHLKAFQKGIELAAATVAGAEICRDLGNEPSNNLYPELLARESEKLAKENGLKVTVLDEKQLAKEKMGLLIGVGQGSVHPPRLIMLEYNPKGAKRTIAFVGKGITFDSGGISIKPSAKMEDMKHDMCGSAAVIGAIVSCAKMKIKTRVICVVASAENMPDGRAIQPGNILKARSGKTVEITNTDAEGRLVLADALDYVQDLKPDYIIDLATLTGAASITLGKSCSGLMTNDEKFAGLVKKAAKASGERVWELPMFEEYFDDLKSEYADMRNSGDTPSHGTAKGAMFLMQYIREGMPWVHLDIATVSNAVSGIPYYPRKSSTGYGVRLLVELAKALQ